MEDTDWRQSRKRVSERNLYALENKLDSDCAFRVGQFPEQEVITAHKLILGWSSPVFYAMFNGNMAETRGLINITDVTPEAFRAMLRFIYTDQVCIQSCDRACELQFCAKKYLLLFLEQECRTYLQNNLRPANVCRVYEFANYVGDELLVKRCLKVMRDQSRQVILHPSFEDADLSTVVTLLEQRRQDVLTLKSLASSMRDESRTVLDFNGFELEEIFSAKFPLHRFKAASDQPENTRPEELDEIIPFLLKQDFSGTVKDRKNTVLSENSEKTIQDNQPSSLVTRSVKNIGIWFYRRLNKLRFRKFFRRLGAVIFVTVFIMVTAKGWKAMHAFLFCALLFLFVAQPFRQNHNRRLR